MTLDPPQRFRSHRHTQEWWREVGDIRLERYPDRESVRSAERDTIKRERPLYNISHNTIAAAVPPAPTLAPHSIVWTCDACGKPIRPGKGYLHVDNLAASKAYWAARAADQDDREDRSVTLAEIPPPIPWQVHHHACDPEPDKYEYWIDVGQWSTSDQALQRAAHLSEKIWLGKTDFDVVLRQSQSQRQGAVR